MPPLANQPNVLRLDMFWQIGIELDGLTRSHWLYSGTAPTNANCISFATGALAAVVGQMIPYVASENAILGCVVTDLTTPSSGTGGDFATTPGSRAGAPLPAEVAFLLNKHIARRYRGGKPRSYLPYGTDADVLHPDHWEAAALANFTSSWATGFVPVFKALTFGGCIITEEVSISQYAGFNTTGPDTQGRFKYPPKPRAVAIAPDAITSYSGNPKMGSQRRRQQH